MMWPKFAVIQIRISRTLMHKNLMNLKLNISGHKHGLAMLEKSSNVRSFRKTLAIQLE